jgi:hypothetical protein
MDRNSTYAKSRHAGLVLSIVLSAALAFGAASAHAQSTPQPGEPAASKQVSFATAAASSRPTAASTDPYFEERLNPAKLATLYAAGILVALLVTAGILLTVRGLREDLRDRKRGYRRRSRRIAERSQRPPVTPAG